MRRNCLHLTSVYNNTGCWTDWTLPRPISKPESHPGHCTTVKDEHEQLYALHQAVLCLPEAAWAVWEEWTLEVLLWLWTHLCSFQFHSSGRDQPEGAGARPPHWDTGCPAHSLWEPKRPSATQAFSPIDRDSKDRQVGRFKLVAVAQHIFNSQPSHISLMLNTKWIILVLDADWLI